MRRLMLLAALFCAVAPAAASAQQDRDGLEVDGSIRARVEAIDGEFRPATDDTAALLLRTFVHAEYRTGAFRVGGELEDARVYAERRHSSVGTTEVDTVEPVQAYVGVDLGTTSVEAGRFTMDLGSRRLVSRQSFRNSTNAFTGARFDWRPAPGDGITAFWTMPQQRLPDDRDGLLDNAVALDRQTGALQFFGGEATKAHVVGQATADLYVYRLAERDDRDVLTRNRRLWTLGGRLLRAPRRGAFDAEIEGAWQGGTARATTAATDLTDLPVSAYFLHARIGRTLATAWSPRLSVAYDLASGDGRSRTYSRFDTLFGARAFEFGPSSFYGPVGRANLSSPEVRLEATPDKRWDGYVAVRPLWLASATDSFSNTGVRDATGRSGRYAGTQIEARARYWLVPKTLRLSAGAALLAKGRFLDDAPNAPSTGDTHYGYMEATFSF